MSLTTCSTARARALIVGAALMNASDSWSGAVVPAEFVHDQMDVLDPMPWRSRHSLLGRREHFAQPDVLSEHLILRSQHFECHGHGQADYPPVGNLFGVGASVIILSSAHISSNRQGKAEEEFFRVARLSTAVVLLWIPIGRRGPDDDWLQRVSWVAGDVIADVLDGLFCYTAPRRRPSHLS